MKLIAISGKLRHGKDTLTQLILDEVNLKQKDILITKIAFADPIKRVAKLIYPTLTEHDLWGPSQNRNRIINGYINPKTKEPLTVRDVLTQIGAWGRSTNEDCWVNSTFDIIENIINSNKNKENLVLISDCRFKNELKAIKAKGGYVVRIIRPSIGFTTSDPSEIDLDDVSSSSFSHVSYNINIEDLEKEAKLITNNVFIE